jgi:hypothetical protein
MILEKNESLIVKRKMKNLSADEQCWHSATSRSDSEVGPSLRNKESKGTIGASRYGGVCTTPP